MAWFENSNKKMGVKPEVACKVLNYLGRMWKSGEFTDFTVVVEDERIQCHRNVLCACSGFFRGLFHSGMKEETEACVKIPNITKESMDVILNSLYTGEDGLTTENVIDVWHASNQLQISFMITDCENFLMEKMNIHNYIEIYEEAQLLDSSVLIEFIHDFMMKNFEQFRQTETFLNVPADILHSMVDSQDLVTSTENLVVESILKWVCFNPQPSSRLIAANNEVEDVDNEKDESSSNNTEAKSGNETRKGHLAKLLSVSRLDLCDPDFLQTLRSNPTIGSCHLSASMIFNAGMHNTNPDRHNDCWPSQAVPRNCSLRRAGVMYTTMITQRSTAFVCFDSFQKRGACFIFPRVKEIHLSITVFNNEVYCYNNSDLFVARGVMEWSQVTQNQEAFEKAQLLSHGDHIYASNVQRGNQNEYCISLHRLNMNTRTDNWSRCMEVRTPSEEHSLASCGRNILLFTQNQQADNTSVSCYDPENQAVRKLNDIEGSPKNITSFCVKKQIYILHEDGSLWKVENCHEEIEALHLQFVSKVLDPSWSVRGATFYRGQLHLFAYKANAVYDNILPTSWPGVFENIAVVKMNDLSTDFCPILAPLTWLSETEASESSYSSE